MRLKKPNSKNATIVSSSENNLALAIKWVVLNNCIKSISKTSKINEMYVTSVRSRVTKKDLKDIVKNKFGSFVEVI